MPIYTKTGDTGETSLFGGKRVLKCNELVDVYGSIDELNSWIGLVGSQIIDSDTKNFLYDVQSDLFVIGGMLAGWKKGSVANLSVCAADMEVRIDAMEEKLASLSNFILPGGTPIAAWTHLARAVCRRVERQIVSLHRKYVDQTDEFALIRESNIVIENVKKSEIIIAEHLTEADWNAIIQYINRLSDLLFDLARFINSDAGIPDVIWSGIPKKGNKSK